MINKLVAIIERAMLLLSKIRDKPVTQDMKDEAHEILKKYATLIGEIEKTI